MESATNGSSSTNSTRRTLEVLEVAAGTRENNTDLQKRNGLRACWKSTRRIPHIGFVAQYYFIEGDLRLCESHEGA